VGKKSMGKREGEARAVLNVGEQIPDMQVWIRPREPVNLRELAREKPLLLVFYLFDWSAT
jgi:peroxiredoxin